MLQQNSNNNNNKQQQTAVNVSREIELKQQYMTIFKQTKQELAQNQVQLQSTFNQLQSKITELKIKDNELSQLKSTIQNNINYTNYLENTNQQLLNEKAMLINKLRES